jgi:hypothetical protein
VAVVLAPLERADQCGSNGVKMGGSGALLSEFWCVDRKLKEVAKKKRKKKRERDK